MRSAIKRWCGTTSTSLGIILACIAVYMLYDFRTEVYLFGTRAVRPPVPMAVDAERNSVWIDQRENMIAVVAASEDSRVASVALDRHSMSRDFVVFRDGRRIEKQPNAILFIYTDGQVHAETLDANAAGQVESRIRANHGPMEDAWQEVKELLAMNE